MKNLLSRAFLMITIYLIPLGIYAQTPRFYLDDNGVTIKCENCIPGDTGTVNGVLYEAVDNILLVKRKNDEADLSKVCTSLITDMSALFLSNTTFNQNINSWDVSNVTNMAWMFDGARTFNQNIGKWDVRNVIDMSFMFMNASSFNQNIGNWDVGNVKSMGRMFNNAVRFNQDIGSWNVSNVTDLSYLFSGATLFNQDIGSWNVSNVTKMNNLFEDAKNFNQDVSSWDVSNVTNMSEMFNNVTNFNYDIGSWNVSKVTNMSNLFGGASSFNQDIGTWDVSRVIDMSYMFNYATSFNQDIGSWNVSNVIDMSSMFRNATSFNQDISDWCVSSFPIQPDYFATYLLSDVINLDKSYYPKWGSCPVKAPIGNNTQILVKGSTLSDIIMSGDGIKWYDSNADGNILDSNTIIVDNTTYFASQSIDGVESFKRLAVKVYLSNQKVSDRVGIVPTDFSSIQSAIDNSSNGDTVIVTPGNYLENLNFNGKNIVLSSLYLLNNDTSYISSTIIDGQMWEPTVKIENNENDQTSLIGFSITNGVRGIVVQSSNPTIRNCKIYGNSFPSDGGGGGILISGNYPGFNYNIANILDCNIFNNFSRHGGGISAQNNKGIIKNCHIHDNINYENGNQVQFWSTQTTMSNCYIEDNTPGYNIIEFRGGSNAILENNIILSRNTTQPVFISWETSNPILINNTIINKNSEAIELANLSAPSHFSIFNSIAIGCNMKTGLGYLSENCCFNNIVTGAGNIAVDPLLNSDLSLSDYSPCIGAGNKSFTVGSTNYSIPSDDYYDSTRIQPTNSNPDIGAIENTLGVPLHNSKIYVNNSTGKDSASVGLIDRPFSKIQSAIDYANSNDTIVLFPGKYIENFKVNKSLNIEGKNNINLSKSEINTVLQLRSDKYELFNIVSYDLNLKNIILRGNKDLGNDDKAFAVFGANFKIDNVILENFNHVINTNSANLYCTNCYFKDDGIIYSNYNAKNVSQFINCLFVNPGPMIWFNDGYDQKISYINSIIVKDSTYTYPKNPFSSASDVIFENVITDATIISPEQKNVFKVNDIRSLYFNSQNGYISGLSDYSLAIGFGKILTSLKTDIFDTARSIISEGNPDVGPFENKRSKPLAFPSPQNFQYSDNEFNLELSWNYPEFTELIDHFEIWKSKGEEFILVDTTSNMSYTDFNVKPDSLYKYKVRMASIDSRENDFSDTLTLTIKNLPPASVDSFTVKNIDFDKVKLTWNKNTEPDIKGYKVWRVREDSVDNKVLVECTTSDSLIDDIFRELTNYTYYIAAVDSGNIKSDSIFLSIRTGDVSVPDTVRNLISSVEPDKVYLSWNANTEPDLAKYKIYRGTDSLNLSLLTEIDKTIIAYIDSTVTNEIWYYYSVTAVDSTYEGNIWDPAYESVRSKIVKAKSPDVYPPATPSALKAKLTDFNLVKINWNANNEPDLKGYNVYRKTHNSSDSIRIAKLITDTIFEDTTHLSYQTKYMYYVSAVDTIGNESGLAEIAIKTGDPIAPDTVRNLQAIASPDKVSLSWYANTESDLWKYRIYRRTGNEMFTELAETMVGVTNYVDTTVTNEIWYEYAVSAIDSVEVGNPWDPANEGALSKSVQAKAPDVYPPAIPKDLSAHLVDFNKVSLNWSANQEADLKGYNISRKILGDQEYQQLASKIDSVYFNDTTLLNYQTKYVYFISSVDTIGNESEKAEISIKTGDVLAPDTVRNLQAIASPDKVNLSWDANTESDLWKYRIYRRIGNDMFAELAETMVGVTNYVDTTVTNEIWYEYAVSAIDSMEVGNPWDPANDGALSKSVKAKSPDVYAPKMPSNLKAQLTDYNVVKLTWSDNIEADLKGYNVYRSVNNGEKSLLESNLQTNTYIDNDSLDYLTHYQYYVSASDTIGNESPQSKVSIRTGDAIAPAIVQNVKLLGEPDKITITWSANTESDLWKYMIKRGTASDNIAPYAEVSKTSTKYVDTNVINALNYYYVITAIDSLGTDQWDPMREGEIDQQYICHAIDIIPPATTSITSYISSNKKVKLTWNIVADNDLWGYKIMRSENNVDFVAIDSVTKAFNTYSDVSVVNFKTYYYAICSVDTNRNVSAKSNIVVGAPINVFPTIQEFSDMTIHNEQNLVKDINFNLDNSFDTDGTLDKFYWYQEGALTSTEKNPTMQFNQGTTKVKVVIEDNDAGKDSAQFSVNIDGGYYSYDKIASSNAGITAIGKQYIFVPEAGGKMQILDGSFNKKFDVSIFGDISSVSSISLDTVMYLSSTTKSIYCFDKNGVSNWSLPLGGDLKATPTIDMKRNLVYVGVSNNNLFAIDRTSGVVVWSYRTDSPVSQPGVIIGDSRLLILTESGNSYLFNLDNEVVNKVLIPSASLNLGTNIYTAPAIDKSGNLYVSNRDGSLIKFYYNTKNNSGQIIWNSVNIGVVFNTSPVIGYDGTVYVGSADSSFYAFDGSDGSLKWKKKLNSPITSTASVDPYGNLYVGCESGEMYALSETGNIHWYYKANSAIGNATAYVDNYILFSDSEGELFKILDPNSQVAGIPGLFKAPDESKLPQWGTYQGNIRRSGVQAESIDMTSIETLKDGITSLKAYPNPFEDKVNVQFTTTEISDVSVYVYDLFGNLINSTKFGVMEPGYKERTLNLVRLSPGIYFFEVWSNNQRLHGKLIKE